MSGFLLVVNPSEDFVVDCHQFSILVLYSANGCVEISQEISLGAISFIENVHTIQQNIILLFFSILLWIQHSFSLSEL